MRLTLLLAVSAAALLAACSPDKAPAASATPSAKPVIGEFGIDLANMDAAVKPGDDFFKYANGHWLATFKMPEDKARWLASQWSTPETGADGQTRWLVIRGHIDRVGP